MVCARLLRANVMIHIWEELVWRRLEKSGADDYPIQRVWPGSANYLIFSGGHKAEKNHNLLAITQKS